MSVQKIVFQAMLNHLATKQSPKWHVHLQASQFKLNGFADSTNQGMLILNIGPMATRNMELHDDHFSFNNRKHGVEQFMEIPYTAIMIIQDPDDISQSIPWPYFLDHGDEYINPNVEAASNVIEFKRPVKEIIPDYLDFGHGTPKVKEVVVAEPKKRERKWTVIEGGRSNLPSASMPFIDEVHRAKQARRERDASYMKAPEDVTSQPNRKSDGNDGTSVFFPDLDVSKCYFATKRIERPEWMTVHQGGKQ